MIYGVWDKGKSAGACSKLTKNSEAQEQSIELGADPVTRGPWAALQDTHSGRFKAAFKTCVIYSLRIRS